MAASMTGRIQQTGSSFQMIVSTMTSAGDARRLLPLTSCPRIAWTSATACRLHCRGCGNGRSKSVPEVHRVSWMRLRQLHRSSSALGVAVNPARRVSRRHPLDVTLKRGMQISEATDLDQEGHKGLWTISGSLLAHMTAPDRESHTDRCARAPFLAGMTPGHLSDPDRIGYSEGPREV